MGGQVITLANSIIGVSILAMPFCFKQCGIILSVLLLLFSNVLTRLCCHFLVKSAFLARRRNYEFLAFHTFGPTGKLVVELSIIGFLLGTCIAFFVVIGDLGPDILAKAFNLENSPKLRPSVLVVLALCVVLPLGLLRNVDSLNFVCTASVLFYLCLVLKVISEATPHLLASDWLEHVNLWRPAGILQCVPIFSMALACQTQVFEIYDTLPDASPSRMNEIVQAAVNMCTGVYISMGFFGYVAFCTTNFTGNVMLSFSPSMVTDVMKLGFVLSLACSFPLVIFPCRASLYSLLFKRVSSWHPEVVSGPTHIPETRFKCLTLFLVTVSLLVGLLLPNIELVLGLVGSTIGTIICLLLPALMFTRMAQKYSSERLVAQVIFFIAAGILVLSTYANLYAADKATTGEMSAVVSFKPPELKKGMQQIDLNNINEPKIVLGKGVIGSLKDSPKSRVEVIKEDLEKKLKKKKPETEKKEDMIRVEPPIPQEPKETPKEEPVEKEKKPPEELKVAEKAPEPQKVAKEEVAAPPVQVEAVPEVSEEKIIKPVEEKVPQVKTVEKPHEQVAADAILKDEKEQAEEEPKHVDSGAEAKLLEKLAEHEQKQQQLLEEQQQIRKELEEHKKEKENEANQNEIEEKPKPPRPFKKSVKVDALNAIKQPVPKVKDPVKKVEAEEVKKSFLAKNEENQNIGQIVDGLHKLTKELKESIAEIKMQQEDNKLSKADIKPVGALLEAKKARNAADNEVLPKRTKRQVESTVEALPVSNVTSMVELKVPQQLTVSEVKLADVQLNSDQPFDVKPITRDLKTVEESLNSNKEN
ncbi:putative sodium-coupled neutral amino acid transporter 10 isoform X2 [Neocloeon triangulifer]|uniref:putative sodium-coupled neutral amino acid transporter 10 isoform X2 n=1 Tax=Neocloeon triangulifer TaxID=2078957 RepID=UPI00286EE731|nr:putative sodium-coupled neutral amino acid transporter 10 isoform X2 [Neocloeon triangulifer]